MSIILSPYPKLQFISDNGKPMAGCQLYTYKAGTSSLLATYRDSTGTAYNTNPIVLDAGGRANIWIDSNIAYKFVLYNSNGSVLWTVDNINSNDSEILSVVNTIADLKSINTTTFNGGTVVVLGYYSVNDGGGGEFTFLTGSTLTADGGIIIQPNTGTGRWQRVCDTEINVLWYGCNGNGAFDNTPYVTAANAYAASKSWGLYIPEGNFVFNSNPNLTVPVRFGPNSLISWSGFALSIQPAITDKQQHFSCTSSATVSFIGIYNIYPEWFGAKGDGHFTDNIATTDDTLAIQYAINSANPGNWIVFNSTKKYWAGALTLVQGVNIRGTQSTENDTNVTPVDEYLANLQYNSTGTDFLSLTNAGVGGMRGISVKDLIIDGNSAAKNLLNLQTAGSFVMGCTLRNATTGLNITGSTADSSGNRIIYTNFRNLTNGVNNSGAGAIGNTVSDCIFVNCVMDLNLGPNTGWMVHDNIQSSSPVTGPVNHMYGAIDYNYNPLGATTNAAVAAGSFSIGASYVIGYIGSTDFTLIGASSNTVGLSFVASGAGTGTGLAAACTIVTATALTIGILYTISFIGSTDFTLIGAQANQLGITFTCTAVGTGTGSAILANTNSQILSSIGGWGNGSSTFAYNSTNAWNNKFLTRYTTTTDLNSCRIHDSLGYDSAARTPRVNTRAWYERDFLGNHHWGDLDTEFMTLDNTGLLSFPGLGNLGKIPVMKTDGTTPTTNRYTYINYKINNGTITIVPDGNYTSGDGITIKNYPCYSVTTPVTQTITVSSATVSIPYALGPVTLTGLPGGIVAQVGQYVVLTKNVPGEWTAYTELNVPANMTIYMLYGVITAFNAITPSMTVNILYYQSRGDTVFAAAATAYYIHSAFPFLLKRPSSIHNTNAEGNIGIVEGVASTYRLPDIGLIFDVNISGGAAFIAPLTTLLSDMIPSTES